MGAGRTGWRRGGEKEPCADGEVSRNPSSGEQIQIEFSLALVAGEKLEDTWPSPEGSQPFWSPPTIEMFGQGLCVHLGDGTSASHPSEKSFAEGKYVFTVQSIYEPSFNVEQRVTS